MFTAEMVIKITKGAGSKSVERRFKQTDDVLDDLREMFVAAVFQRSTTTVESLFDQAQEEFAKKEARKSKQVPDKEEPAQDDFAAKEAKRRVEQKAKRDARNAKTADDAAPTEGDDA